jgi:anti-sigma regulatory factor (Ser/Thr protein kinase)
MARQQHIQPTSSMRLLLPRIPDIELVAIDGIERLCKYHNIASNRIDEAKILVSEVVINAMEHGHTDEEDQEETEVNFKVDAQHIHISVRDYGPGFDVEEVPVPDIDKKMHAENKRGWGLQLMRSLADDMSIDSGPEGTTITLVMKV